MVQLPGAPCTVSGTSWGLGPTYSWYSMLLSDSRSVSHLILFFVLQLCRLSASRQARQLWLSRLAACATKCDGTLAQEAEWIEPCPVLCLNRVDLRPSVLHAQLGNPFEPLGHRIWRNASGNSTMPWKFDSSSGLHLSETTKEPILSSCDIRNASQLALLSL